MARRPKLRSGDVFTFDLDGSRQGVGQIIGASSQLYITILATPHARPVRLDAVDARDILLCGRTSDAHFYHGLWKVIGSQPIPDDVPRPCSKVNVNGERWIADFNRTIVRVATDDEWDRLDFEISRSPLLYEDAYKGHLGIQVPGQTDHKMHVEYLRDQEAICAGGQ